ncbi:MAG: hypothetical protein OHK0028_00040 [Deltaproteobacteria bacterium]
MSTGRNTITVGNALPAAIVSIQTAGKFLNRHPHLHVLAPAGPFRPDGNFVPSPRRDQPSSHRPALEPKPRYFPFPDYGPQ